MKVHTYVRRRIMIVPLELMASSSVLRKGRKTHKTFRGVGAV